MIKNVLQKLLHFNGVKNRFKICFLLLLFTNKDEKTEYNKRKTRSGHSKLDWSGFRYCTSLGYISEVRKGLCTKMVKKGFLNKHCKCLFVDIFEIEWSSHLEESNPFFHRRFLTQFLNSFNKGSQFTVAFLGKKPFWFANSFNRSLIFLRDHVSRL